MVARVQTGAALNAVLELEVHIPLFIKSVALRRADTCRAFVRTG
ncbi:MAG: hypothetical protein ACPG3U_09720 [Rhodothermales bacterium]